MNTDPHWVNEAHLNTWGGSYIFTSEADWLQVEGNNQIHLGFFQEEPDSSRMQGSEYNKHLVCNGVGEYRSVF